MPWMLSAEFGGLRPWELRDLTPREEGLIRERKRALDVMAAGEVT